MTERRNEIKEFLSSKELVLERGVLFILGASRGALYDLNTGNVYSINQKSCEILSGCIEDDDFWEKLKKLGLANTRDRVKETSVLPESSRRLVLSFVWFEVCSNKCNEKCVHCYAESLPPLKGISPDKLSDRKRGAKIDVHKWKNLIRDSYLLGCRRGQFIGGEPFMYKGEGGETLLDLVEYARIIGYDFVEIFTNATMLTKEKAERIKNLGAHVAVSLYSIDPEVHDSITQTPGSCLKTINGLEILKEFGIPTRVEIIIMKPNEHTVEETIKYIYNKGFLSGRPDIIRPSGRGNNLSISPSIEKLVKYGLITSPNFRVDKDLLFRYLSGNSCLMGKIVITDAGDVIPCIFSRDSVVGNVINNSLEEIVKSEQLKQIWSSTKDDVLVCQDCEYRYVCFDCRALSAKASQGRGEYLSAPYPRCTYNPYTGKWARGVWQLDKNGLPYYDETLEPTIGRVLMDS